MKRSTSHKFFLLLLNLCFLTAIFPARGERNVAPDKAAQDDRIHLVHSDRLYFDELIHPTATFLVGNVQFSHKGALMYCDSALFYEPTNSFDAFGHVRMVQGDTLSLDGEELYYDGMEQLARMRHQVVLRHRESFLHTDSLDYDRIGDLGYFHQGGQLDDQNNRLVSDWGEYSPTTRQAIFYYNVRLVNPAPPAKPSTILTSDTLYYNTLSGIAHIEGPSNIEQGESRIYSEHGFYHTQTKVSYLLNRSQVGNNGKVLVGDSLVWDEKERIGKAFGNVVYNDTLNRNMFTGHYVLYNDSTGYSEATDSATLIEYSEGDTLYVHADTFKLFTYNIRTDSVYRLMHGYFHVRAFRTDVQAVCDSMVFSSLDSCLTLYKDPVLWQEEQQVFGEEIKAFFNDSTLDSVNVLRQAMTIERLDSTHFNQVSALQINSYFNNGQMDYTTGRGNVMVNYYPFDSDSLMIGLNHTESTHLKVVFKDRKVNYIWMPAATGTMYPLNLIPPDVLYLEGFAWFDYMRPQNKYDLYEWRPKKAGTELKRTVRREAPRQRLSDIQQTSTNE